MPPDVPAPSRRSLGAIVDKDTKGGEVVATDVDNDPRMQWLAQKIFRCLHGLTKESVDDLFNDYEAYRFIISSFEKVDGPTTPAFIITIKEGDYIEPESLLGATTKARGKPKLFPKLRVTDSAVLNTNITGSIHNPPDRTRCLVFARADRTSLTVECVADWKTNPYNPIHKAFEISSMQVPSLTSFHVILTEVFMPMIREVEMVGSAKKLSVAKQLARNKSESGGAGGGSGGGGGGASSGGGATAGQVGGSTTTNRHLLAEINSWVTRLETHLKGFMSQVCAERKLPIPQNLLSMSTTDNDLQAALGDEDLVRQVDQTVAQWQSEISYAMSLDPRKEGPLGEIEYWREKYSTISALYEQINSPQAKFILQIAKEAECNSSNMITVTLQQFFHQYTEAKDNVKFLGTLDRHFRIIQNLDPKTSSLTPIIDTLSSMMTAIRMVWIISRFYSTEERMVGLLEKVAKLIALKVSEHIDFRNVLSLPPKEAREKVTEGQQCLLKWKATYVNVQEEINSTEREQHWNFDQRRLFETTDYMSDRCTDLLEVIDTVEYYTSVLSAQLKTVLMDTSGIDRILKDVERLKRPFETLTFNPFEKKATHNWQVVFSTFVSTVTNLDQEVAIFINKIFDDDLRSAESAFELLLSFRKIQNRPDRGGVSFDISAMLSEKADRILAQFFNEAENVQNIFLEDRENPPLTKNQPPVAGSIHWSMSLFQRLKKPIFRFQQEGMLLSAMGKQIKLKYVEVARQMKDYATARFLNWREEIIATVTPSLKLNILRRDGDDSYAVNFDMKIFDIIREAKYLDRLGFEVPQEALHITLQDEAYHHHVDSLKAMLFYFNYEIGVLEGSERLILARNIRELKAAIEPGFTDINWTSLSIPDFVSNCDKAITKFRNLSREVRKSADHIQTQVVNKIATTTLMPQYDELLQAGGELPELQNLVEIVECRRVELVEQCARAYRTAKPLLTKVESQLVGTHTGKCPYLSSYYSHWEHRIWRALTKMVIRSLAHFAKMVGYRASRSHKRLPLFKVMIFLTTEPTYSPQHQEITSAFHKIQSGIIESTKAFQRWMRGTCIEFTQGEIIPRPAEEDAKTLFTYYRDIFNLPHVYKLQAIINRTIQTHLGALATNIKLLQRYNYVYFADKKISVEQQAKSQYQWIDYDAKFQLYFNMIADFDAENHVHDFGFMRCDESPFYSELVEHVYQWVLMEGAQLNDTVRARMTRRFLKICRIIEDLKKPCDNIDDLKAVLEVMHNAKSSALDAEQDITEIEYIYNSLLHFNVSVDKEELAQAMGLRDLWACTLAKVRNADLELEPKKEDFRNLTEKEVHAFLETGELALDDFRESGFGQPGIELAKANQNRIEWRTKLGTLQMRRDQLTKAEKLFGLALTSHTSLQILDDELKQLEVVYALYEDWMGILRRWNRSSWKDLLLEDLETTTEEKAKAARILMKTYSFIPALGAIQELIVNFQNSLPLLAKLKSPSLKGRHWKELIKCTGKEFNYEQINLQDLISMELFRFTDEIDNIVLTASRELSVENEIREIKDYWLATDFTPVKYEPRKGQVRCDVLADTTEIQEAVDDNILKMQSIANVRWAQPFIDEVKLWEKKLLMINDVLAVWVNVQMKWQYLESIFKGNEDICVQLPKESAKFNDLDKKFVRIMNDTSSNPNVSHCCNVSGRLEELRFIEEKLEECQKDLSNYLETKRSLFPRFYFISDDELLSILASSSAKAVQDHMLKMFDNCAKLLFKSEADETICGVDSQEGERCDFATPVKTDRPVEAWLQAVLEESRSSLHDILKAGVFYYPKMQRLDWVKRFHGMVTLTGAKIFWTYEIENAFRQLAKGKANAVKELSTLLTNQLFNLVSEMDNDIDRQYRKKINTLIIVDVHGRDIVDRFVRDSVMDAREFDWESQLRFYWTRNGDTCVIQQCTGLFRYGFEYMGLNGRLVITPLTDRCFMTLTQALTFFLGGAPGGPAGTGKTESVKDLAKAMAIQCVVFNCGEGLDYKAMGTIFSGLSQTGSWGCFDEFNRIELPVLSVVSEQLRSIQAALRAGDKQFLFGDTMINLVPTVGTFITMNPGYAGRVELPDNLKALFRPVVMVVPDMELIAENMLFSEGFTTARELAKKMVTLYALAKGQLSKQHHYDWGLRALKAVLVMAGQLKRGSPELSEESVLMRALRDMNAPKFIAEDEPLFKGLIGDLFPGLDPTRVPNENLAKAASKILREEGFQVDLREVDKVVQLYETMQTRHTSMVVGPTGGGKSVVIDTLCKAQTDLGLTTKYYVINPKAQPTSALYGLMDPMTRNWTDGIFSCIFRSINRPAEGTEKERRYVIFDGDVDAKWVEDMNSVMDDNKLLTLPNGERIRLHPQCSLLFEVGDLQYASPATVSRVGMVFLDPVNLGWEPFMYSWKLKRPIDEQETLRELVEQFVEPLISFVMDGLDGEELTPVPKLVIPTNPLNMVKQLATIIHTISPVEGALETRALQCVFIFACVWSFGAFISNNEDRARFDAILKRTSGWNLQDVGENILSRFVGSGSLPERKTMYDYFFDLTDSRWKPWNVLIQPFERLPGQKFSSLLVSTVDTERNIWLLNKIVLNRTPVMFVGESGTAKTVTIHAYLGELKKRSLALASAQDADGSHLEEMLLEMNFSSRTTSLDAQRTMEDHIEKRTNTVLGPPAKKRLVVFVDDINMPKVDLYGTQQPIAFLKLLIEHQSWYDRKDLLFKNVRDTQFVAAMAPPGGGRNELDRRFVSLFTVFNILFPEEESIHTIYAQIFADAYKAFPFYEEHLSSAITDMTLSLYQNLVTSLPATPAKFHYIFNLRDLSRVYEGLCRATPEKFPTVDSVIRLWRNEIIRVFIDRMSDLQDKTFVNSLLEEKINRTFPGSKEYALRNPMLFGDFGDFEPDSEFERLHIYEDFGSDYSRARSLVEGIMDEINTPVKKIDLVMFEMALEHLLRIVRVISIPRGHCLLVGVGGSGKMSLTKLGASICQMGVFEIVLSRSYGEDAFREDLKRLYHRVGVQQEKVVFLFLDGNVKEEGFLELINNMLASGMVPALFPEEEKEPLYASVSKEVEEAGMAPSKDNLWTAFVSRCRDNLHVVLSMSPSGDALRTRCRNFPSLINNTTIDWFEKWPSQALQAVGEKLLRDDDLPDDKREAIVDHMVNVHLSVDQLSERYHNELKRHNYVTPKNFLGFLANYSKLLITKREKIDDIVRKFTIGLEKLHDAQEDVKVLQEELAVKEVILSDKQSINEKMTAQITEQKSKNQVRKEEALEMEEQLNVQNEEIETESAEAKEVLTQAMPALQQAELAVRDLEKKHITELRSFAQPAHNVKVVVRMVCVVKGVPPTWEAGKIMMGQSDFMSSLRDINQLTPTLTQAKMNEVNRITKELKIKSEDDLLKNSIAAAGLMKWVNALKGYWAVAKEVLPKQERVRQLQEAKDTAERQLAKVRAEIEDLTENLHRLEEHLEAGMKEARQLQAEKAVMERRLLAARKLIDGFGSERLRWSEEKETLGESRQCLIGDCLAGAAFLSYLGAFTFPYRQEALESMWLKDIQERTIPLSENFTIRRLLTDEVAVSQWASDGLPSDELSVQNGILTTLSNEYGGKDKRAGKIRFPLCIDPQMQAVNWIKRQHANNTRFEVASFSDPDFLKRLEFAIQYGNPFLFEGVDEFIDPVIDSILDPQFRIDSGQRIIRIGDKDIPWDNNFKLYLCTKLPNPNYPAEVFGKTMVINYGVTEDGLEAQLLNFVVASERSDLQRQSEELVQTMAESRAQLKELEDTLIRELTLSTGNILDNDDLISTLENTKSSAVEVEKKLSEARETARTTEISRQQYRPAARRGAVLYFVISQLSAINSMYEYSLHAFLHDVFGYSITKSDASFEIQDRLQNIISALTYNLYCYVCMGIFEKDKLMLSFQIAIRLLTQEKIMIPTELEFFLKGCVIPQKDYPANPTTWLTERQWNDLCKLRTTCTVFSNLVQDVTENEAEWKAWWSLDKPEDPENAMPNGYSDHTTAFQKLCVLRCFRSDRVYNAATSFITNCELLGEAFVMPPILRYKDVLDKSSCLSPVVCIVSPGANPTDEILKLANKEVGLDKLRSVALGQGQGEEAMKMVELGAIRGHWVLLQNCHLLTMWMKDLEKAIEKMDQQPPHEEFRLWLTTEPSLEFPMGILQRSLKVVNEPPNGLKMNMKNTLSKVSEEQLDACPHWAFRPLVFTLSFYHAVVQERRKYGKIGWNVIYDFNETDFTVSMRLIDTYLTKAYQNNDPIPWETLRYLVGEAMYGGRVSDSMDRRIVKTYLEDYFGDFLFDTFRPFHFFEDETADYCLPPDSSDSSKKVSLAQMLAKVESLPNSNTPDVFGLHPNAETGYLRNAAEDMWLSLIELMPRLSGGNREGQSDDGGLMSFTEEILSRIPAPFDRKQVVKKENDRAREHGFDAIQPTQVVLLQEMERWNKLVTVMIESLKNLQKALAGVIGMSSELDELASSLSNGQVPPSWRRFAPATRKNLGRWLAHFQKRYGQYLNWSTNGEPKCMWLSGLMVPDSYLSALVQVTCRKYRWPLDRSTVVTTVTSYKTPDEVQDYPKDGAFVSGLFLEGARWDEHSRFLSPQLKKQLITEMPVMQIIPTEVSRVKSVGTFKTPVYVTSDRRNAAGVGLVFMADLPSNVHQSLWILESVALVLDSDD